MPVKEDEMKECFVLFLWSKTARGKQEQLSPVTITSYARSMLSMTCHNSVSSYVRENYRRKDGTDLMSLLFHLDRPTRVLDIGILLHFFPHDLRFRPYRQMGTRRDNDAKKDEEDEDADSDDNDPRLAQQKKKLCPCLCSQPAD